MLYCPRYGFIHDRRLPTAQGRTEKQQKQLEKEMSRVDKWLKMDKVLYDELDYIVL